MKYYGRSGPPRVSQYFLYEILLRNVIIIINLLMSLLLEHSLFPLAFLMDYTVIRRTGYVSPRGYIADL
jgi:hypothetical protein